MTHNKLTYWLADNQYQMAGFLCSSIVTPSLLNFTLTVLQTAALALTSGVVGALGAWLAKKIITKYLDKNGKV